MCIMNVREHNSYANNISNRYTTKLYRFIRSTLYCQKRLIVTLTADVTKKLEAEHLPCSQKNVRARGNRIMNNIQIII